MPELSIKNKQYLLEQELERHQADLYTYQCRARAYKDIDETHYNAVIAQLEKLMKIGDRFKEQLDELKEPGGKKS